MAQKEITAKETIPHDVLKCYVPLTGMIERDAVPAPVDPLSIGTTTLLPEEIPAARNVPVTEVETVAEMYGAMAPIASQTVPFDDFLILDVLSVAPL